MAFSEKIDYNNGSDNMSAWATLVGAGITAASTGAAGGAQLSAKKNIAAEQLALAKYNQMLQTKAHDYMLKQKEGQMRGAATIGLLGLSNQQALQGKQDAYAWLNMIEGIINNRPDIRDRLLQSYLARV